MTVESYGENFRPYLLACCGIVLLVVIALVFFVVRSVTTATGALDEARLQADGFLSALEKRDFPRAHAFLTSEGQAATSEEKLNTLMQKLEKKHGKALRHSPYPSFHFNDGNTQVSLSYWERWEQTETTVLMDISQQREGWRIKRFDFLEP